MFDLIIYRRIIRIINLPSGDGLSSWGLPHLGGHFWKMMTDDEPMITSSGSWEIKLKPFWYEHGIQHTHFLWPSGIMVQVRMGKGFHHM
jgi:hypothetical protein